MATTAGARRPRPASRSRPAGVLSTLKGVDDPPFCYLTTVGRRTGAPHTIEIWYAREGDVVYLISERGEASDWVRNLLVDPVVTVRIGEATWRARARPVRDGGEKERAGRVIAARYQGWVEGDVLPAWLARALPVALEELPTGATGGEGR